MSIVQELIKRINEDHKNPTTLKMVDVFTGLGDALDHMDRKEILCALIHSLPSNETIPVVIQKQVYKEDGALTIMETLYALAAIEREDILLELDGKDAEEYSDQDLERMMSDLALAKAHFNKVFHVVKSREDLTLPVSSQMNLFISHDSSNVRDTKVIKPTLDEYRELLVKYGFNPGS